MMRTILWTGAGLALGWAARRRYEEGKGLIRALVEDMRPRSPEVPILSGLEGEEEEETLSVAGFQPAQPGFQPAQEARWEDLNQSLIRMTGGG